MGNESAKPAESASGPAVSAAPAAAAAAPAAAPGARDPKIAELAKEWTCE